MSQVIPMHGGPPIKIGGEWIPNGRGPNDNLEVRVAYALRHGETLCKFMAGVTLTQLTLFKKDYGWLVMLKGARGKEKLVAFLSATDFSGALVLAATSMDTSRVPWKKDEPPPVG